MCWKRQVRKFRQVITVNPGSKGSSFFLTNSPGKGRAGIKGYIQGRESQHLKMRDESSETLELCPVSLAALPTLFNVVPSKTLF